MHRHAGLRSRALLVGALLFFGSGDARAQAAAGKVERFTLENGLRVILRPATGAKSIALVVVYDIGGDHDPQERSGLAHLVEHVYCTAAAGAAKARTAQDFF